MLKKALLLSVLGLAGVDLAAGDREQQRAMFVAAEQALGQGRLDEARRLRDALADYPLKPYLWFKTLNDAPGTESEIPAFLERYGETRYAGALRRKWLDLLAQRESWDQYVRYYRDVGDARFQCDFYWALHRLGRDREAYAGAARLWGTGDPRPAACDRLFSAWQASPGFTPEQVWKRLGLALGKNQIGLAGSLRSLVPEPDRSLADFWFEVHGDPLLVEQCARWSRKEPVLGRIFAHGIDRLAEQEPLRALNMWNLRRSEFQIDAEEQARIERRLALTLATRRYPQAEAYLGAVPDEAVADAQIRAWRVRAALLKRYWPGALLALERLGPAEKRQTLWRYWRARALEAVGDASAAQAIYRELAGERELYGFLAADRVGLAYPLSFDPTPVPESELRRMAESDALGAIQEFRALNRPGEAQREWVHVLKALPQRDLPVAAKLAQQWGWHRLAILAMAKAENRNDLSLRFPLAYSEPVLRQARERRLDPALVYSVIRRESAFDADAKSGAGALGLMQLMPGTGEQMARALGEGPPSERALLDPQLNLRYGTAYFRRLLDRFDGHLALAAAAYNAGPGRVERWLPTPDPLPADIWIETIPYAETRQYVAAIFAYAAIYQRRLGDPPIQVSGFLKDVPPGKKAEAKPDRPLPVPVCR
jgi:soluble lytic murein transglycosylase